ncbi:MAG: peptidylprolyl isomerase, partial [Clostridia bacterium]|nr:peptidylprolyl isomerase [Clostridia bacterium]
PLGNGTGGSKKRIKGEFLYNGVNNPLKHTKGVLSMARTADPNSATSQFFICLAAVPYLDGQNAAFGKLIAGEEALERIASVPTDRMDKPTVPQRMKEVYFVEKK